VPPRRAPSRRPSRSRAAASPSPSTLRSRKSGRCRARPRS